MKIPKARKRFGQHFLHDQQVLQRIIQNFAPEPNQTILEIGPGRGALTDLLVQHVDHLTLVELDRDLVELLNNKYASETVRIIQQDILKFEIASILPRQASDKKVRIIGNLPYNISTPLLFHLLQSLKNIEDMVFMLQKEVANRLCASTGSKDYGRLSVMTRLKLNCTPLFDVQPESFSPPPKVISTVARLKPLEQPPQIENRHTLNEIVRQAFSQRRKTLRNSLKGLISSEQLATAEIEETLRPENITPEQFVRLANMRKQPWQSSR